MRSLRFEASSRFGEHSYKSFNFRSVLLSKVKFCIEIFSIWYFQRSILLLKAPFLQKDNLQETYCNLTSDYSCYRGGLYSMEEAQTHSPCKESPKDTSSPPDSKEINSKDVEIIARIAFVIAFTIFNLVYWIVLVYFVWVENKFSCLGSKGLVCG